ncbi:MAG TPA: serine hydrolase domain-containing protein [Caulobacteraceae bacterium]|nr:serine hydrolase domain-containing protein [Caulobacteraceae bacterium]
MSRDLSPAAPEEVGLKREGLAAIDAFLQGLVDKGELAGVVTLVARHGRLVHSSVMGMKDIASGEPLASDTIFRIFSMTKPVTGVAMSILLDQGLWSPDDPIRKYVPQFESVKVFAGLAADGTPKLSEPDHAPTMRELMTHTAGLSYGFDPKDPLDRLYQGAKVWESGSLEEFAAKVARLPLAYQPGSKWRYSLSMDVQGAIVEKLSGQSLPDFYRTRIFEPLGMADTAFHTPPHKKPRLATLYRWTAANGLEPMKNPLARDHESPPALANGGGGLVSTAADYARFAQMLLNGGELHGRRIVGAEALKLQMSNHLSDEIMRGGYGVGLQQIRPGYGHGFDGAVFTDPAAAGVPVGRGTYQWDGAAGTWFWVDPVHDLLYVGLIQRLGENAPALQRITQTMMADAYA